MQITLSTPLAGILPELDARVQHLGSTWDLFGGSETLLVSEFEGGERVLALDLEQMANAEIVTVGDAIEAAVEEYDDSAVGLHVLRIIMAGEVLLTPRATVGRYVWSQGPGFACLVGPAGEPTAVYDTVEVIDPDTGRELETTFLDTSAYAAAVAFVRCALKRGARRAIRRHEERSGLLDTWRENLLSTFAGRAAQVARIA